MARNRFELLAEEYPETLILQLRGSFYNAFNDGAMVLSDLMDYQLKVGIMILISGFVVYEEEFEK